MKIALVGTFGLKPKATVSARAIPLAEALVERGHHVVVIVPPWDNPADSGQSLTFGKVPVLNARLPPRIPVLWYLILTWRLLRLTLGVGADVVHVFKPKAFAGLVASALWFLKLLGISRVRLVVDTDDWEGAGGWNEIGGYSRAQRLFFALQEKWVLRQADAVTAASRCLVEIVSQIRGNGEEVFYLPNALKAKPEQERPSADSVEATIAAGLRQRLGLGTAPVILLYTRFFEFGVGRTLAVLARVAGRIPDIRLLVIGRGLFGEEKELERLAGEKGLAHRVVQAGWVDQSDLPAYFSAADAAIYPYDDNLVNRAKCSVKLLELLGAGVPVVADRVGQNAECIEDGQSGVLVEPGDSGAMADAVLELLDKPEFARRLGQGAQQRVRAEFCWKKQSREAERAYERAGEKRTKRRSILAWLPAILWMGFIFYLSSQPSLPRLPEPLLQAIVAKLAHFGEYALLALLLFRALRLDAFPSGSPRRAVLLSALLSFLYGISDEIHQSFVPNRHSGVLDVLIDSAGAALMLGLLWRIARLTKT